MTGIVINMTLSEKVLLKNPFRWKVVLRLARARLIKCILGCKDDNKYIHSTFCVPGTFLRA